MKAGIIIPNYCKSLHHVRMLEETLKSISLHERGLLINTVIVDDDSPLPDRQKILLGVALKFGCRVLFGSKNVGYAATVNKGMKLMRTRGMDFYMTLNSDCELVTPFFALAEKMFNTAPNLSVIGGMLFYPSGKIQSAGQTVHDAGGVHEHFKNIFAKADLESTQPKYIHSVTGAMQIIRAGTGYLDESYPMAYEDVEFCMRQWSEGRQVFYQPHIKGIHREGATRGRFPSRGELVSIEQFEKMRATYDFGRIHRRIENLNRPLTRRPQAVSPQL